MGGDLVFTADRFNGSYNNGEFEVAGTYLAPGTPVYLHGDRGHSMAAAIRMMKGIEATEAAYQHQDNARERFARMKNSGTITLEQDGREYVVHQKCRYY